jgi:hypothetical protein
MNPRDFPESVVMKSIRNARQIFADQEKEKPRHNNSGGTLGQSFYSNESGPMGQRHSRHFFQAGSAKDAVFVFCNALAAEKLSAFRTERDRLADGMIEAALMSEVCHGAMFKKRLPEEPQRH